MLSFSIIFSSKGLKGRKKRRLATSFGLSKKRLQKHASGAK
jgi:hypothetical protein